MDDMTQSLDLALLDRYLLGECTPAEQDRVRRWMATSSDAAAILATLARAGERPIVPMPQGEIDTGWERMQSALAALPDASQDRQAAQTRPRKRPLLRLIAPHDFPERKWTRWIVAAAATFIVALTLTVALPYFLRGIEQPEVRYATKAGEQMDVTLTDGSKITLGPATQLRVIAGFGKRVRKLELTGQAYFDVVHDSTCPFSVRSGGMVIEDIGTRFGVRSYYGDSAVRIAVAHGSVAVLDSVSGSLHTAAALVAGDVGRFSASDANIRHHANVSAELGWMTGTLVFTNTPFREVLTDLERMYDIEIAPMNRSLAERKLTFDVHGDSIDRLLHLLSQITGTQVERHGRLVRFTERPKTTQS